MPEKILELLESCSLTKEQIAEKINVTLEELDAAMEYLQQMGYSWHLIFLLLHLP